MVTVNVNDFTQEKTCIIKEETYSVRDNGAVLRHSYKGRPVRTNDNQWTFGKENAANPYLHLSNVRIHRIVATAFHGDPPDPKYVVDHIDTNCRNNRPENLRWLTRLENALKNPVTRKKIEYLCGSIEAFLENPSILNDLRRDPSYSWMRTVTKEEAQNCKARMAVWANSETKIENRSNGSNVTGSFAKRAYKPLNKYEVGFGREPGLDVSKTLWCATYMFAPNVFPLCPESFLTDQLEEYFENIKAGEVFAYTDANEQQPELCFVLKVFSAIIQKDKKAILVLCERSDTKWIIVGVELYQKNKWFIHYNLGVFLSKEEAEEGLLDKRKLSIEEFYDEGYKNAFS